MDEKRKLKEKIQKWLEVPQEEVLIENPKNRTMGDYAIPCFPYAKKMHKNPLEIANFLKEKLESSYEKVEVVNGYVNLFLPKKKWTQKIIEEIIEKQESYGNFEPNNKQIVIEYSSPNIAKPFGVGHLRSTVIGEALKNICKKAGFSVYTINYLGDYGTQFGKLIYAYKTWGNEAEMKNHPIDELKRVYVKFHEEAKENPLLEEEGRRYFKKLEEDDLECLHLWQWFREESLKEFQKTYDLLGINSFDSYTGESYYKDKIEKVIKELEEKNLLEKSDGATIVSLEELPPALIKRSDGATLYITRDLSAVFDRKEKYNFDEILYVAGNEQILHFEQLKRIVEKMGYPFWKDIHHIGFGLILKDGKKMSTRQGKSVKLQDVLEEAVGLAYQYVEEKNPNLENKEEVAKKIGVGAVTFNDLKNYRMNDIEFHLEDTLRFEGNTGPYVQYTYARINSLLENRKGIEISYDEIEISESIWNIIQRLNNFKETILSAKENYDPSYIAKYLLDLCSDFNHFYAKERIIDGFDNTTEFKCNLAYATSIVIKEGMRLLGISVINKM